jgi:hypothetical protein
MNLILRFAAMLAVVLAVAGCRGLLPAAGGSSDPLASGALGSGEPRPAGEAEAPQECGFPPGTPLEYAGRSTTAELDVQEVIGDPMSDDPADIYITRDPFAQGEHFGRLVCAVFVDHPGFVEVTLHPEDGGRFEPTPPLPSVTPPPGGITKDEATEIALAEVDRPARWEVAHAEAGPIGRVEPHVLEDPYYEWARDLDPDRWVWRVFLVRGDRGVDIIIDHLDGTVLGTAEYIVN